MANLKRIVAQTFADWLAGQVPELVGNIHTVQSGPNETSTYPCAALISNTLAFEPFQAWEVWAQDPDAVPFVEDGKVLINVGDFTGDYELRLYAQSVTERENLEEKVLHAMLAEAWRPGVVSLATPAVTVNSFTTLYEAPCAFMVEREVWQEEFAFENRRFAFLDLTVQFPALILRSDTYTVTQMILALTEDLGSDTPTDSVEVSEDGEISEV